MKTIEITITADGEVTIEAKGYVGAECEIATKELEAALGTPTSRRLKPKRFKAAQAQKEKATR